MIEPRTVTINQKSHLYKRSHDPEQNISSKHIKCDVSEIDEQCNSSISDTDTESKCSTSDTEESNIDQFDDNSDNEDSEDDSTISTDQSRYNPVVLNKTIHQKQSLSRHSKKLIKQFKYLYDHSKRKIIEPTQCIDENFDQIKKFHWELRNTFNRIDLLKEGYAVLSDQSFPFYSLCCMVSIKQVEIIIKSV
jgi:hypothetical protein